mgnify:CR=1 FL=1
MSGRTRRWAAAAVPLVLPVCVLAGGMSVWGRPAAVAAIGLLAAAAAALVAGRALPFRPPYLWIGLLAALLVASFAAPAVPVPEPPGTPGTLAVIAEALGVPAPRPVALADLIGVLAGLALTAVCVAFAPGPRPVTRAIALTGAAAAGYALLAGEYTGGRLEALGCNPNYLGLVFALPIIAAAGLVRYTRSALWLLPAAVCAVALIDTQSRSATLTVAVGLVAVVLQDRPARVQAAIGAGALAVVAAAVYTGGIPPVGTLGSGDRGAADLADGNALRARVAAFAVRVIAERPLRGAGYHSFPELAERSPMVGVYLTTHNEYLRFAAEAGVAAAAALLVLILLGARHGQTGDLAVLRAIVLGWAAAALSLANPLGSPVVSAPFWAALGCLLAHRPGAPAGAVAAVRAARGRWRRSAGRAPGEPYPWPAQRAEQQPGLGGARQQRGGAYPGGPQEPGHLQGGEQELARAGGHGAADRAQAGDERRGKPRAQRQGRHRRR